MLSPEPLANRSVLGFQAQMNTSDSWPRNTVALLAGISIDWSTSMLSGAFGVAVPLAVFPVLHVVHDAYESNKHEYFGEIFRLNQ